MDNLMNLLVMVIIFMIIGYGAYWVCVRFGMPAPVTWIVGAILLIAILYFALHHVPAFR